MKNIAVFLADGFEEIEGLTVVDILRRAGLSVDTVSVMGRDRIEGSHAIPIIADKLISDIKYEDYDCFVLPGGMPGTKNLEACGELMELIDRAYKENKYIAAICAAPSIFGHRGILKGRDATCYPGMEGELTGANALTDSVVVSDNVITSRGMGTAIDFALDITEIFCGTQKAKELSKAVVYS
ncbi:MAG: DJ-1/PfpI family protein [Lachnospiraceae bacterium]|nr:DJ-1/PfpI family protein [Lachnospiraceae bacterium]